MFHRILVVCVGNICRSPMAEVLLADALGDTGRVSSAGIGALVGEPEVVARGMVVEQDQAEALFRDAAAVIAECIENSSVEERTDQGLMTEKLRGDLRRFFKKRSGRRPLVLPVLMEI